MVPTERLPADVLADILGRLEPRWLAVSRSVRKAWHDVVDDRHLLRCLRKDLLPLSMSGIFVVTNDGERPFHFARPPHRPVGAGFDYLDTHYVWFEIQDHCNGLLLIDYNLVINPATQQWARLPYSPQDPPPIPSRKDVYYPGAAREYLAFDPTISPHYEVFEIHEIVPRSSGYGGEKLEAEWPPAEYPLPVFSSRAGRWEVKTFVREGDAAGDIADMRLHGTSRSHYGAYWWGSLYVRQHEFVLRVNSSSNTYRVIKLPRCTLTDPVDPLCYRLGKSKKGVYCALDDHPFKLWIWFLNDSCGQMEWILRKKINLEPLLSNFPLRRDDGPWRQGEYNMGNHAPNEEELEWDSDDDTISDTHEMTKHTFSCHAISILGFHPSKEIVFLLTSAKDRVLAYHVNSSKIEDLGSLSMMTSVISSFPFTPCLMEVL